MKYRHYTQPIKRHSIYVYIKYGFFSDFIHSTKKGTLTSAREITVLTSALEFRS